MQNIHSACASNCKNIFCLSFDLKLVSIIDFFFCSFIIIYGLVYVRSVAKITCVTQESNSIFGKILNSQFVTLQIQPESNAEFCHSLCVLMSLNEQLCCRCDRIEWMWKSTHFEIDSSKWDEFSDLLMLFKCIL